MPAGKEAERKDGQAKSETALKEEETLKFWEERRIFEQSTEKPAPNGEFIFYEGPPTANGKPGVHHLESRAFKDAIPRYKTMRGFRVPRRAGWDTHGLPVELEVEKELGFSGKKDIEVYGIAAFNKKCRESVFKYIAQWEAFTKRMGYWVDQSKAYFTFDPKYMESVWSIVKKVHDDGRLYKDYKVVPWCARCGTVLSSHELAQGYEEVKDLSLTVKFELVDEPGTFLLAWTTTPWTLPGNVALAVGKDIDYVVVERDGEKYIVAKERLDAEQFPTILKQMKGADLVGKEYKPLYPFSKAFANESESHKFGNAFRVYAAPFVTTEDGTGIVHIAPMYGQDDFELGQQAGLPKVHLVGTDGKFIAGTGFLEGRFVKEADEKGKPTLAVDIADDLKKRGLFFSQANHPHSYPFCWRCKTPLIYYARDSWYIRMHDLRAELLAENATVHWEPSHLRDGRMGEWLANAKEWAISRERYWSTPLPVWTSEDGKEKIVIGSVQELKARTKKSGNRYFAVRHGTTEKNLQRIVSDDIDAPFGLTEDGKAESRAAAEKLAQEGVTVIYASPFPRTKETAGIIADELDIPRDRIVVDDRLREFDFGDYTGRPVEEFHAYRRAHPYDHRFPGGESDQDAKNRFGAFLYDIETKHQDAAIAIVTHGIGFEALSAAAAAADAAESQRMLPETYGQRGEVRALPFVPLPHNENFELDLHRPYIDEAVLVGDSGAELKRTPEVMDVWLDSGSMPFAQDHYPFENKEKLDTYGFPADFISEAIDQTRGWFYTLLAVGTLMRRGAAYRNVISLGHLLDANGQKMSKSKGNVIEPMAAMDRWGADALRFWMYSVNQAGDSKSFDEKTVKETQRALSWLENSAAFYALFKDAARAEGSAARSAAPEGAQAGEQVIDAWMRARVNETIRRATASLDAYQLFDASRAVAGLFEDLSQWYVRRIRDRAKDGDASALETLRFTLDASARLLAPFAPFLAERVYQIARRSDDPESVHLAPWPKGGEAGHAAKAEEAGAENGETVAEAKLIEDMQRARELASEGLKLRQQSNIKVRQPLASASIPGTLSPELRALLAEELNVKEVRDGADALALDTTLTPELVKEGDERALARAVAEARKALGLAPKDKASVVMSEGGAYEAQLSTGIARFDLERAP